MADRQGIHDNRDLRVIRTYESLFGAFERLMGVRRLEDITISELCDEAMVRRATFYAHFSDKQDFVAAMVRWIQHSAMASFRSEWKKRRASGVTPDRAMLAEMYVRCGVAQLERHRVMLLGMKRSGMVPYLLGFATSTDGCATQLPGQADSGSLVDILAQLGGEGPRDDANAGTSGGGVVPELREQFVAGALAQSVMWWLEDGHGIDRESFITQMSRLMLRV
ncbi:TetR/AcrR family transcriptional regulator [Bifidobacterium leontopitheci]|uniref:TetR family transcriptional regulator n=1 Tax=Bifidobacterium leontopitheci TaxID=2650774 RepID=A0A6I1GBT8_9BIFI|nr:TetR/AcrR family transcriptional regulator [Bifidobacterium leontopitheci]KAB7789035.1 TetR family transcriptional regulator [Bifidobacterium leontopitheci]